MSSNSSRYLAVEFRSIPIATICGNSSGRPFGSYVA